MLTGWRRLLPVYVNKSLSGWKIRVFPLQSTVWFLGLSLVGYLGVGTALYLNDRVYRDLTGISWFDRVYPPRWEEYRVARGNSYVEQAKESLNSGEFSRAFHQIRAGIGRSPANLEGRLLVADMLNAFGQPEISDHTLIEGIKFHYNNLPYIQRTIRQLFSRQKDAEVITLSQNLIARSDLSPRTKLLAALSLANAYFYRGHFDQAEDTLEKFNIAQNPEGRLLIAKIEWDRGFQDLAMALISQLAIEFPSNLQIYRTQVQWLITQDEVDSARRASLLRRIKYPDQAQPRIDLLYAFDKSDEDSAVDSEAQSLFSDFGENYSTILQVGDFAANTGRTQLAERVFDHAQRNNQPLPGPALMVVESMIVAGNYRQALEQTTLTMEAHPDWEAELAPVFNGLQAICYHALGEREEASLFLDSYLGLKSTRAENLVAVSERLLSVGANREARRVLAHAVDHDPLNQAALTRLIEFDLNSPDAPELPSSLGRLLTMRRASPVLLRDVYDRLGEDRYHFVQNRDQLLDRLLTALSGKGVFSTGSET